MARKFPKCQRSLLALFLCVGLMPTAWPADAPGPDQLQREGRHDGLELSACSRAMLITVSAIEVADRIQDQPAPPGHRWLSLDLEFENRMPADLLFDLDYPEQLLVASVVRQMFLLVNGRTVARSMGSLNTMPEGFIMPHIGAKTSGTVVYPIAQEGIESLSLRYYHDQYLPVIVPLAGKESLASESADDTRPEPQKAQAALQRNDVLELAVAGHARKSSVHGVAAPEGMEWLVVELVGRSRWTLEADALALDRDAEIDARVQLPKAMEYVEAAGLLQVVVDGRHGYPRDLSFGDLPAEPVLLPDTWAGGRAVFAIPGDAGRVELAVHYPLLRGEGIETGIPETMRFDLFAETSAASAPSEALVIADDPTPLTVHRAALATRFAEHRVDQGRALLRVEASMRNTGDTGGMMAISQRLSLTGPNGNTLELLGAYLRGPLTLDEPFWLPAGGEPRAFILVYDAPDNLSAVNLGYGGVSVNASEQLEVERL